MLSLNETCAEGETICDWVLRETGSQKLATVADWVLGKPLALVGLLILGLVIRWLLHRVIDRLVRKAAGGMLPDNVSKAMLGGKVARRLNITESTTPTRRVQRAHTMGTLLKSIATGLVFAVIVTMMLDEIGVNIAPIIASAGILGVALGFGAQSLVSDFLSGLFMIFEDQYGVGDEVNLGEASGTVEAVSLRVTRLRDVNGTVWYVRNGEILRVGNMSQNWARTVLDVSVAYGEDIGRVQRVLGELARDVWEDEDFKGRVIEEPSVWGVQELGPDAVVIRVALKTAPLEQWAVAREMRQRIKARFDHEGIEIPFAQRVVWVRQDAQQGADPGSPTAPDADPAARRTPATATASEDDDLPPAKGSGQAEADAPDADGASVQ